MNTDGNERNQDATLFVGELDAQVTESLLWELFLQAGPVGNIIVCCCFMLLTCSCFLAVSVHIPRDKVNQIVYFDS
jgi:RNA recognition motif-containing protein